MWVLAKNARGKEMLLPQDGNAQDTQLAKDAWAKAAGLNSYEVNEYDDDSGGGGSAGYDGGVADEGEDDEGGGEEREISAPVSPTSLTVDFAAEDVKWFEVVSKGKVSAYVRDNNNDDDDDTGRALDSMAGVIGGLWIHKHQKFKSLL
jgi:hypothetical protein